MSSDFLAAPADPTSTAFLANSGLRYGLVDTTDRAAFGSWLDVDTRGFHGGRMSEEVRDAHLTGLAYRRTTGVWDDTAGPVATVNSWTGQLTVPGERAIDAWAISSVTVSPTHRRRGIARNLLEGELRTAASLGVPLAMLTVSESTIYSRFGFAPAAMAAEWRVDTRRARWTGPTASGRIVFIDTAEFRDGIAAFFDRERLRTPGQIDMWDLRWDQISGLRDDDAERVKMLRAVRYEDADGVTQGYALYRVTGGDLDFTQHSLSVEYLLTATDDAYAGLWRFLLEQDLVTEVVARLRSVDEPLRWQIADFRSATVAPADHLWLRILDVAATLSARTYAADCRLVIDLADSLEFTAGRYLLEVTDGAMTVTTTDAPADLSLGVNELSALYLGGVLATTLVAAGRIDELHEGSAAALDASFRADRAPWLSVWF